MKEMKITGLAAGAMTDRALERLSRLDHLERLLIEGAGELTDQGLQYLARLPRLQELEVGGPKSLITDRGVEVLRHLRELRRFQMCWSPLISDAGIANLTSCEASHAHRAGPWRETRDSRH